MSAETNNTGNNPPENSGDFPLGNPHDPRFDQAPIDPTGPADQPSGNTRPKPDVLDPTVAPYYPDDIVVVDAKGRGHRPSWNGEGGVKQAGGQFLSNYEMNQIGANHDFIMNNLPEAPPDAPTVEAPTPEVPNPVTRGRLARIGRLLMRGTEGTEEPSLSDARQRINDSHDRTKKAKAKAAKKHEDALAEVQDRVESLETMRPEDLKTIEVLERVPKMQERLLKSKYLGFLASREYRDNSFTLLEYQGGPAPANHASRNNNRGSVGYGTLPGVRDSGDRRADRFVVKEVKKGVILPHVVRGDDRGRKRLPDARTPSVADHKRRDALVVAKDGSSWAGGLQSGRREAIGVGKDAGLIVIGVDNRPLPRRTGLGRFAEGFANFFNFDRRRFPNGEANAMPRVVGGNAGTQADINNKIRQTVDASRINPPANVGTQVGIGPTGPVPPPHPHDRLTPRWHGWGTRAHRFKDYNPPLPENDRDRQERPERYHGF